MTPAIAHVNSLHCSAFKKKCRELKSRCVFMDAGCEKTSGRRVASVDCPRNFAARPVAYADVNACVERPLKPFLLHRISLILSHILLISDN